MILIAIIFFMILSLGAYIELFVKDGAFYDEYDSTIGGSSYYKNKK